jgi:hypothetical protein
MTTRASGPFEVKLNPLPFEGAAEGAKLGRLAIDKQFHGDLEGTSRGQMLSAGTDVKGSAGYVVIEQVAGTLHGRHGTFVLQHTGTMNRGAPSLSIIVVPDSGTDQLVGLTGTMAIVINDGRHTYEFEYEMPV